MSPLAEAMFWLASALIVPVWGLMWFLPDHHLTKRIVGDARISILPLLLPYIVLVLPVLPTLLLAFSSDMPSPQLVVDLFADEDMVALAWIHMLALDTLAGRFVWQRMLRAGRGRAVSFPTLFLCVMVAPLGVALGLALTWNTVEGGASSDQNGQGSSAS